MRMFAKFLVFSNLILSLIFLGWAIGLYTQRLDWAPHKNLITGEFDEKTGLLYHRLQEIDQMVEARNLAELRWQTDTGKLSDLERKRLEYQKWYADQLELARSGKDTEGKGPPKGEPPVVQLIKDPEGNIIIDKRVPLKSRDQVVKAIQEYEQEYRDLKRELDDLQVEIEKLVDENKRLTEEIAGIPGKTKGLRAELDGHLSRRKLFDDEMLILRPLLVTQRINVEQQKQRLAALQIRMKELLARAGAAPGN